MVLRVYEIDFVSGREGLTGKNSAKMDVVVGNSFERILS
jgi:hypothetical protein